MLLQVYTDLSPDVSLIQFTSSDVITRTDREEIGKQEGEETSSHTASFHSTTTGMKERRHCEKYLIMYVAIRI